MLLKKNENIEKKTEIVKERVPFFKNKLFWNSILVGICGFLVSFLVSIKDIFGFNPLLVGNMVEEYGEELISAIWVTIICSGFISFMITIVTYILGALFYKKVQNNDIRKSSMDREGVIAVLVIGIVLPLIVSILDRYLYAVTVVDLSNITFTILNLLSTILNNGILEEIWFRYGIMSLFIYAMYRILDKNKKKDNEKVSNLYVIVGAVFTSLVLFLLQLNGVVSQYSVLNIGIILRAVLNYLVLNLGYSYLCVRYDVKWSVFAHIIYFVFYLLLYPLLFSVI